MEDSLIGRLKISGAGSPIAFSGIRGGQGEEFSLSGPVSFGTTARNDICGESGVSMATLRSLLGFLWVQLLLKV